MRKKSVIARRGLIMFLMTLGLIGIAVSPATARELCNPNGSLALADGNGDGVVSRGEIQAIINAAGDAPGASQLQGVLNGLPADVTGIRYTGCTADGGTDPGTGEDPGIGTGIDTDGDGVIDGIDIDGDGVIDAVDTDGDGIVDMGEAVGLGETVVNAEGTPVNSISGLPDTGQGATGSQGFSTTILILGGASMLTLIAVFAFRKRWLA